MKCHFNSDSVFEGVLTISLYTIKAAFFEAIISWNDGIQTTSEDYYGDQSKTMTTRACVCLLLLICVQILCMDLVQCKPSKSASLRFNRCRPGGGICLYNGLRSLNDDQIFNSKVNFFKTSSLTISINCVYFVLTPATLWLL